MKQRSMIARMLTLLTAILLLLSLSLPTFATEPEDWTPENMETPASGPDQPIEASPAELTPEAEPAQEPEPEPTSDIKPTASLPIETETPTEAPTEPEETEPPQPAASESASSDSTPEAARGMLRLTPDGNLTLVDDMEYTGMDEEGNVLSKQFITVQSRDGSFFYIIIDRTGETENVYFLNQVDLADLKAAASNEPQEIPEDQCTCTSTCMVGHIDKTCPVCRTNMTQCAAIESPKSEDQEEEPNETPPETDIPTQSNSDDAPAKASKMNPVLLIVLVAAIAGIGVLLWKGNLFGKGKQPPRPEYDEDDEDEDDDNFDAPDDDPDSTDDEDDEEEYSFASDPDDDDENEYTDDNSLA